MVFKDRNKLCRLCLASGTGLIEIFCSSTTDLSPSLDERINLCLSVKVCPSDKFPTKLCLPCLDSVNKFFEFRLQTEASEKRLREWFSDGSGTRSYEDIQFGERDLIPVSVARDQNVQPDQGSKSGDLCQLSPQEVCRGESNTTLKETSGNESMSICTPCCVHRSDPRQPSSSNQTPCIVCNEMPDPISSRDCRKYVCSVCDYSNASLSNFKIHMMKHNGEHVARCRYCDKGFYSRTSCTEHELVKHEGKSPVSCDKCKKSYHSKAYLRLHMKTHLPNYKNDGYQCDSCGKTFKSSKGVRRHRMADHAGRLYCCDVCDKEIKSLDALKNHLKIHSGEKSLACPSCGKFFRTKSGLKVHERIHTGAKPYRCQACGASFTQSSSLKIHAMYHRGDRPFQCDCSKKFVTLTLLKTHQLKHHIAVQS